MNKQAFASVKGPVADVVNEAGGRAYSREPESALAQMACTGTLHDVFYSNTQQQLDQVLDLARQCDPEWVAKVALYARRQGAMKDMPALLVAYLSTVQPSTHFRRAFEEVIDNGKMLRNFFQVIRSGAVGRRSLGGGVVGQAVRSWFQKDVDFIFRQSHGNDPSMADVLKTARPKPASEEHIALFQYLLGKGSSPAELLPESLHVLADFAAGEALRGDLPFEMVAGLREDEEAWKEIARRASWQATRMNLNTFQRHGVREDPEMVELLAARLRDPDLVAKARAFPYQLMVAHANFQGDDRLKMALEDAMEHATQNVPKLEGKVFVLVDISCSMLSPVTGHRAGSTTKVRCVDVAALIAASVLRKNSDARVVLFNTSAHEHRMNPRDTVMTNAQSIARKMGGGTSVSSAPRFLEQGHKVDTALLVSDDQSWFDHDPPPGNWVVGRERTPCQESWRKIRARNGSAMLASINLQPYATTQIKESAPGVLHVGGWSDEVFRTVSRFRLAQGDWCGMIE